MRGEGGVGVDVDGLCADRICEGSSREENFGDGRGGTAAPQLEGSGRLGRSEAKEPRPRDIYDGPRGGALPRGPVGNATGAECSGRDIFGDLTGALKFLALLGPVGARNAAAGPRGGDLGIGRSGERSLGVDLSESRSR